jgi:hypothetical protein
MAAKPRRLEVRHSQTFNLTLAAVGITLLVIAGLYGAATLMGEARMGREPSWIMGLSALAILYYIVRSLMRFRDRRPQVVVDRDGVRLGFGRDVLLPWDAIQWARVRGTRSMLQIGVTPELFAAARVSLWNLDDSLTSIPGGGSAIGIRGAGLDTRMRTVLDSIHAWKPALRPHR